MTKALTVYSLCLSDSDHRKKKDRGACAARMAKRALKAVGVLDYKGYIYEDGGASKK